MTTEQYKYKQVIIMRKDLNLRKGKHIAQGAHASINAFVMAQKICPAIAIDWFNGPATKICVHVPSEIQLLEIIEKVKNFTQISYKIPHALITDAGYTEFKGVPTITCGAVGPYFVEVIDQFTKDLPLL